MGRLKRSASKWLKETANSVEEITKSIQSLSNNTDIDSTLPIQNSFIRENPSERMLLDYYTLLYSFPGFPKAMLSTLVIRERGNMKAISSYLQDHGWGRSNMLLDVLRDSESSHFTVKYFWGEFKPSFLDELKKNPVGSYFTSYKTPHKYLLHILTDGKQIYRKYISTPEVEMVSKDLPLMDYPLPRPCTVKERDLVPFMFIPTTTY